MDKNFIEEMKNSLIEMRNHILQGIQQKTADFSEISATDNLTDYADIASSFTDQQLIDSIGQKDVLRLKQINSALLRIAEGHYGRCIDCGKEISTERLRAIPYALKCISCQSKAEKTK